MGCLIADDLGYAELRDRLRSKGGQVLLLAVLMASSSIAMGAEKDARGFYRVENRNGAESLFNGRDLTGWDRYLGVPEVPAIPFDLLGLWPDPIGRNRDPAQVFSVVSEDGEPAIRITGEIWGALISKAEYENYHLSLQYKWGEERHAPRADAPRNTGVLYHSTGPDGAFWSYWMRSAEFEVMEGRTGDFTAVDGIEATGRTKWDFSAGYPWVRHADDGVPTSVGGPLFRIAAREDLEKPGQWNRLDLLVDGDSAVHIVNGEPVLTVDGLRHDVDGVMVPLTRGAIQLQSEGAEVFFRRIEIRPLDEVSDVATRPEESGAPASRILGARTNG